MKYDSEEKIKTPPVVIVKGEIKEGFLEIQDDIKDLKKLPSLDYKGRNFGFYLNKITKYVFGKYLKFK